MRPACLALACALLAGVAPAASFAGFPEPANSTIPAHLVLVGHGPAGPDSATGHVTVTFRDLANNPIAGAVVTFDFSACTDLAIATDPLDPRLTVDCTRHTVAAVTDQAGQAHFTILGRAIPGPPSPASSVRIYADGILLGGINAGALERDGAAGLSGVDLSQWAADFFGGLQPLRADLNGDGSVSALDLSTFGAAYFSGRNSEALGTVCP